MLRILSVFRECMLQVLAVFPGSVLWILLSTASISNVVRRALLVLRVLYRSYSDHSQNWVFTSAHTPSTGSIEASIVILSVLGAQNILDTPSMLGASVQHCFHLLVIHCAALLQ